MIVQVVQMHKILQRNSKGEVKIITQGLLTLTGNVKLRDGQRIRVVSELQKEDKKILVRIHTKEKKNLRRRDSQ